VYGDASVDPLAIDMTQRPVYRFFCYLSHFQIDNGSRRSTMYRFDELPWWTTRPLVFGGLLLVTVSNALPVGFKAIGLWTGVIFATCGFLVFFWHGYRGAVTRRRGISRIKAVDFIVLSLAAMAIFSSISLGVFLAQKILTTPHPDLSERGYVAASLVFAGTDLVGHFRRKPYNSMGSHCPTF
jgi:hypothetical protein